MAGKPAKEIAPPKRTTTAVFSGPAFGGTECFTPNWDKEVSGGQGMTRAAERVRMGKKTTPRYAGNLIKKG
jgi:hypothetical protein